MFVCEPCSVRVRLIQTETRHKRRSYARGDDCSSGVVVRFFFFSPHLATISTSKKKEKSLTKHTNQSVSKTREKSLRFELKNYFSPLKKKKQLPRSLTHPPIHMIKDNSTSAHRFVKYSLFSRNAGKKNKKGDHGSQSSWGFPLVSVSVSYCLIHQVDLSVFEPQ